MRNGHSTQVKKVIDFNALILSDRLKSRALSKVYLQYTLEGNFRQSGYVAYDYNRTAFAFTKKEALSKLGTLNFK
jgi:hypothetical protein